MMFVDSQSVKPGIATILRVGELGQYQDIAAALWWRSKEREKDERQANNISMAPI